MATKRQIAARKRMKVAARKCKGKKVRAFRACMRKALKTKRRRR